MPFYTVAGLCVDSDLLLPGLITGGSPTDSADVTIRHGDVPTTLEPHDASGPTWQIASGAFLLHVPGILSMLLSGGREIRYEPAEGVSARDLAIFISGTGLGILMHQRGLIVLHASAVRVGNSAVLFCGPSGAGKSTLAAALCDAGHALVSDDVCAISIGPDGRPWVQPDGRQMKLWQLSIDELAMGERRIDAVRPSLQKFYVEPREASLAALPLAALYVLDEHRSPAPPEIRRLGVADTGLTIRANAYRPTLIRQMRQQSLYFQAAVAIGRHAGVFTLSRMLDFQLMPAMIERLVGHWDEPHVLGGNS